MLPMWEKMLKLKLSLDWSEDACPNLLDLLAGYFRPRRSSKLWFCFGNIERMLKMFAGRNVPFRGVRPTGESSPTNWGKLTYQPSSALGGSFDKLR